MKCPPNFFKSLICFSLPLFFSACTEEVDLNKLNGPTSGAIVVEGNITSEKTRHLIKLSRTAKAVIDTAVSLLSSEMVSGAKVSISDGTTEFLLEEADTIPGFYFTSDSVQGEVGETYTLFIEVDGKVYTGSSTMVAATPFDPVINLFQPPNRLQNPIPDNFEVFELQFGKVYYGTIAPAKEIFITLDPVDSSLHSAYFYEFPGVDPQGFLLNFSGYNQRLYIKEGSEVVQIKYSMNKEHYAFIKALYDETHFRGGIFDRIPGNVPTNMSNGAKGLFSASEVIKRTFVVTKELLDEQEPGL